MPRLGGLIGLRVVADNPDCFDRVVAANTRFPLPPELPDERVEAVHRFRDSAFTPTFQEVEAVFQSSDDLPPEYRFAYFQKWIWEMEDLAVGALVAGGLDGGSLSAEEIAAYDAPFPEPAFKMGPRAMPSQVPTLPDDPTLPAQRAAWQVLSQWTKPFLCAFTDNDLFTSGGDRILRARIPGTKGQPHVTIQGGGHFLQESRGEVLAQIVTDFVKSSHS